MAIKILVEQNKSGSRAKILEPKDGVQLIDILTALCAPVANIILEATDNDREKSIEVLTALLDSYVSANDINLK